MTQAAGGGEDRVVTINAGSTSVKVSVVAGGTVEQRFTSLEDCIGAPPENVRVIAHRVVHGGERSRPALVDDHLVDELRALCDLAPLHQELSLDLIARTRRAFPHIDHVACFDTAFHATVPEASRTYALPARLRRHVRSYGFHGVSCAWTVRWLGSIGARLPRLIVAHLGGGQSLTAVLYGESIMNTMGFTPLDGLVMGTRSGALDPGAVLWLARREGAALHDVLLHQSGLVGLCGTDDLRDVLARCATGDADAELALGVYLHRLTTSIGSCVAALGGLDALVFTGGIGEHADELRRMVVDRLGWLGVATDDEGGATGEITAAGSRVRVFVVEAHEDLEMAQQSLACVDAAR